MTRSELASLLGAPAGRLTPPAAGATLISESDPRKFMESLAAAVGGKGEVFLADPHWGEREKAQLTALLNPQVSGFSPQVSEPALGWLMIPTGGTSGRLKFARHDEATIAAAVQGFVQHFGLSRVNAAGLLPLHHVSGLMGWMRCAITGGEYRPLDWRAVEGGTLPALPAKPEGWVISLVPTQLERLLRNCRAGSPNPAKSTEAGTETRPPGNAIAWLRQFRIIFLGGAPAWPALLDQAAALGLPLSLGYGMTETAAMVTALQPAEFLAGKRSNGTVLPHAQVSLAPDGTILIAGRSVFRGYYPEWREEAFGTSDLGRMDDHEHLQVLGRRDAVIITGGEKVEPTEVEAVLRGSGEFPDVVVLGVPHQEWGQLVIAAHPASTAPDPAKVAAALTALAPFKRPKRYVPMSDWPVNASGKVDRQRLLAQLGQA